MYIISECENMYSCYLYSKIFMFHVEITKYFITIECFNVKNIIQKISIIGKRISNQIN